MAARDGGADRAALLRRYNAANASSVPTQDLDSLNSFDNSRDTDFEDDREFSLPIRHVPTNNLVTENLQQASMDTPIDSSNIGYRLLKKMGWKDQTGLGRGGSGIIDPIRIDTNLGSLGVGKLAQDQEYTNAENVKRKALDIEVELTPEQSKRREIQVEREKAIKEEVAEIVKVFYCELCNKQYKMITEYEAHLSSYDHNHKKRFQEMRQMERARNTKKDKDKGVDKEMQRLMAQAAAAQQKYGNALPASAPPPPPPPSDTQPPPPPPPNDPPPPPPPTPASSHEPPRSAIQFGLSAKKPALSSHSSFSKPPPSDVPPPPPSSSPSEPARPAVKFGFAKKPGFLPNQASHPPPPPPDTPPPPPPDDNRPPPPPSQPVKFSFTMQKKR